MKCGVTDSEWDVTSRAPSMRGLHRSRRRLAGATCLALALFAELPAATASDFAPLFTRVSQPVSIPAGTVNGAMVIDVTINGSGPFHMLVDTGCSASVISPEVALAVDALSEDTPDIQAVNALGSLGSIQPVLLESIELGGVRFEGVIAGVTSLELQSKVTGVRIDGLLGYSLFSELFLTFDFPNHRLRLSSEWPQSLPPIRGQLDLTEHNAVPFVLLKTQGRSYEMMLDTGANGSLEFNSAAAASLAWKVGPRPAGLVAALGGTGRDWLGRLAGVAELGGVRQIEPVVAVVGGVSRIGTEFYRSFCVVFSRAQNKLWLCAATDDPIASPPRRSVGLSLLADTGGWRVAGTIPDSPAENARVAPGDLIAAIEHSPAQSWSRDDLQQWIDHHPVVTLSVTNSNGEREVALPVWSLVP